MKRPRTIVIKDKKTGVLLASAVEGEGVRLFEGAWYFDRTAVDMARLAVSERTYVCPYKGICYWIDLDNGDNRTQDVAFTYFETKPGYEFVKDKIGFFAGRHVATVQETTP